MMFMPMLQNCLFVIMLVITGTNNLISIKNFRKNNFPMAKLSFCDYGIKSVSNNFMDDQSVVEMKSK